MKITRLFFFGILLLTAQQVSAQGWDILPEYTFRLGGRAQVRRIIQCEDYQRASLGFVKLRDSSSVEELVKLSHRHNPALQLYAAMALADRHYPRLPEVFARLMRKDHPIPYHVYRGGGGAHLLHPCFRRVVPSHPLRRGGGTVDSAPGVSFPRG